MLYIKKKIEYVIKTLKKTQQNKNKFISDNELNSKI